MKYRSLFLFTTLFTILLISSIKDPLTLSAQSNLKWSPPQRIPGYADDSDPPFLVADSNRTVHAFGSQKVGNDLDIFYSQWTLEKQWTYPDDILLSPNSRQAKMLGAFLDSKGMMHVAFYGGFNKGEIYYARVSVSKASDARSWSWPKNVGDRAASPAAGTMVGNEKGELFILYNGTNDGNGLYEVHSLDGGDTWSQPVSIFSTTTGITALQAIVDWQGRLHAVWTEYNVGGTGEAIYYARAEPERYQWSVPFRLRSRRECVYESDWPTIVSNKDELIVLYNCDQPPHQWMNQSLDGGKTWAAPVLVYSGLKGENGPSVVLADSSGLVHSLIPKRTDDERIHALWHSQWNGKQWTVPVIAVPSVPTMGPSYIKGTISQGNVILMVMRNDLGGTQSGAWYSYATLNSPALPTQIIPTPLPTLVATPNLSPTVVVQPSPTLLVDPAKSFSSSNSSPLAPQTDPTTGIILAIIPILLILIVLVTKLTR